MKAENNTDKKGGIYMEKIFNKLIEMGMDKEEATNLIAEEKSKYISIEDYNTTKAEIDVYKANADTLNDTIKNLEKEANLSESLKLQIEDYKNKVADKDNQIQKIKYDAKLEIALNSANARNVKALRGLLNMESITLGEDGNITGLEEQLVSLRETDGYLFNDENTRPAGLGGKKTTPRKSAIKNPFSKEHFNVTEQCRLIKENPVLAEQLRNQAL